MNRPSIKQQQRRQWQGEWQNLEMGLGLIGAANGAANAFQWDQFDAPDDAAAAADAYTAAAAWCVHSLSDAKLYYVLLIYIEYY